MIALLLLAALANPVDELADKVIRAYGGVAAWQSIASFRQTGIVTPAGTEARQVRRV